jgi:2-polyprenyl-6-methoxyphenol hydroxylase-like FAD-dependent oxidoreductase
MTAGQGRRDYDVAIVGGSLAGCAAATLYARAGARVALIEKSPSIDHYKVMCTHFIQPTAYPVIERLGLLEPLREAGAVFGSLDIWTAAGWVRFPLPDELPPDEHPSVSVRRQTLDPMLRRIAVDSEGVDYMPGMRVDRVLASDGRVTGVVATGRDRSETEIRARLVVAADGRDSTMAAAARVPARVKPHGRFGYLAYFTGVEPRRPGTAQTWLLDPEVAYTFPNEDGITVLAGWFLPPRLRDFKRDPAGELVRFFERLPSEGPDMSRATMISKPLGKLDLPNRYRPPAARGMAFVGDAALSTDPVWGVGCGWALQSAEWLVDATSDAVVSGHGLDAGLERYGKRHRSTLGPHHFVITDLANARRFNPFERLVFKAAVDDPVVNRMLRMYAARSVSPFKQLTPSVAARLVRAAVSPGGARNGHSPAAGSPDAGRTRVAAEQPPLTRV